MSIFEKLRLEIERYQNKPFLKAAMAVCALTASSDGHVSLSERYRIDAVLDTLDDLKLYDPNKAVTILDDYLDALADDPSRSTQILHGKIAPYADRPKTARTLLRIAYLVMTADDKISAEERRTFEQIAALLTLDPDAVVRPLSEAA